MCYCNECAYCESPILVGDEVIHLGDTLFHPDCFASYNDELDEALADAPEDEDDYEPEDDIDGPWSHYVDEWPAEVADEDTLYGWDDDWASQYDDDPSPYSGQ